MGGLLFYAEWSGETSGKEILEQRPEGSKVTSHMAGPDFMEV